MIENNIKASIISGRPKRVHYLSSAKNIETYKYNINNPVTSSTNSKLNTESSSFFGSYKPRGSGEGFFGSQRKSYVDDRPSPESPSDYYAERKKIIFGEINIKDNEKEILKLILDSQNNSNKLIKGKKRIFLFSR